MFLDGLFEDWQSKIPPENLYKDFLYTDGSVIYFDEPIYGTSTEELLRHVRNFVIHFKKSLNDPNLASD